MTKKPFKPESAWTHTKRQAISAATFARSINEGVTIHAAVDNNHVLNRAVMEQCATLYARKPTLPNDIDASALLHAAYLNHVVAMVLRKQTNVTNLAILADPENASSMASAVGDVGGQIYDRGSGRFEVGNGRLSVEFIETASAPTIMRGLSRKPNSRLFPLHLLPDYVGRVSHGDLLLVHSALSGPIPT